MRPGNAGRLFSLLYTLLTNNPLIPWEMLLWFKWKGEREAVRRCKGGLYTESSSGFSLVLESQRAQWRHQVGLDREDSSEALRKRRHERPPLPESMSCPKR